jgi:hypothetical protein
LYIGSTNQADGKIVDGCPKRRDDTLPAAKENVELDAKIM